MAGYRLTPRARDGLLNILDHAERCFGSHVAEEVLGRLAAAFEFIAEHPRAGHRRADLTGEKTIRFWSVGPTLIAYRVRPRDPVEILIVERGEKDWERAFEDEIR